MRQVPAWLVILLLASSASSASGSEFDHRLLKSAGLEATAASLSRYFESLVPTPERAARVKVLVKQLGDEDYWLRLAASAELRALPLAPVDALEHATRSSDAEIVWRARQLLEAARRDEATAILLAVLRTVTEEEISGLCDPMLGALGILASERVRNDARRALAATASASDAKRLRDTLVHPDARIRLLAVDALASADDRAGAALRRALDDDSEPVRLASARALLNRTDRAGLPTLVDLMSSDDPAVRLQASEALSHVSGRRVSFSAWDPPKLRAVAIADWKAWIAADGRTAELNVPLPDGPLFLDRILVSNYSGGFIVELDGSGKERWRVAAVNPFACRGLPNGNRLVAVNGEKVVKEYDGAGKLVWTSPAMSFFISGVRRLSNDNTLIVGGNQILEINRAGETVWKTTVSGAMDAERLANGNTLVALFAHSKVVEVDSKGGEVRSAKTDRNPYSLSALANGNVLVACFGTQRVIEYDRAGKKVREFTDHPQAYAATRLPDGRTFIADTKGMHEYDPSGKKLWSRKPIGSTVYTHRF